MGDSTLDAAAGQSPDQALTSAAEGAGQDFANNTVGATESGCLTYIEILVVDEEDQPVTSGRYRLVLTDGSTQEEDLPDDGRIFVDSIPHGDCKITFEPMIGFGVTELEVKRSWESEDAQGDVPAVDQEQRLASTGD